MPNRRNPTSHESSSDHVDFIKARLPNWIKTANPALLSTLRICLINSNHARHNLKDLLAQLEHPATFLQPLFNSAVKRSFWGMVDADRALLVREWSNQHLLGLFNTHARTTEQSLFEAALQNFEPSEAEQGGMDAGSGLFVTTNKGRIPTFFTPAFFANFCRNLDLGNLYQQHLNEVFDPTTTLGSRHPSPSPREVMREFEKTSFEGALHIAHLQGEVGTELYQQLMTLQQDGLHPELLCSHLTIDGITLAGVLVIRDRRFEKKLLLYTPHDPLMTFRRHKSMENLKNELTLRLLSPRYLDFFNRFIPQRHRGHLITITPARLDTLPGGRPSRTLPAKVNQAISRTLIAGHLFEAITEQRIAHIKSDARALVVPTADADMRGREERLHRYKEMGLSVLFFAASFIPVLGEVLLAVTGAQLIKTAYNGLAAWSRGNSEQALNDLMDVVDTVVTGLVTAGAIKAAGFTAKLVKVKLSNQTWRLWNPDLTHYRSLQTLPDGLLPNAQGLYEHNESHYLKLGDETLHHVKHDTHTKLWHVQHPSDTEAFTPALLSNGAGAWRHQYEAVKNWDEFKLVSRLGADAATLDPSAVETVLKISNVDITLLRQLHQDMIRPPSLLRDTLKHFNFEKEINNFTIRRAEGLTVSPYSPLIQFHLLSSLPDWPPDTVLKIIDDKQNILLQFGKQGMEIRVTETQFRKGELLRAVEEQMPASTFEGLAKPASIPREALQYLSKVSRLATRLSEEAVAHKQRVFSWLCEYSEKPATEIEKILRTLSPTLTTYQMEELSSVLDTQEQDRLLQDKKLSPVEHWEAERYIRQSEALRQREGIFLDSIHTPQSLTMTLFSLEQLPGWPENHRIDIRDQTPTGSTLGSAGAKNADTRYILTREGEQYGVYSSVGKRIQPTTDFFLAIEHTLSDSQRQAIFSQTGTISLKQAVRKYSLPRLANTDLGIRGKVAEVTFPTKPLQPFDVLFAFATPVEVMKQRADGICESLPKDGEAYRYFVLQEGQYYQVKRDPLGWQLIDARNPFRAYKPYIGKTQQGHWAIDPNKGALLGGMPDSPPRRSSVETKTETEIAGASPSESDHSSGADLTSMVSAEEQSQSLPSDSSYHTGDEVSRPEPYTQQELEQMHSSANYQYSQNYRHQYDRANNGRYPLRDVDGLPLRIKFIQAVANSHTSKTTIQKDLVLPFIKWQSFEEVARLYDEKMEVVPFTAAHQKFPQESSLIGESTVITRRVILQGEVLGVYGGELLPTPVAKFRKDPYLMDIQAKNLPKEDAPGHPSMMTREVMLSGDNITSRINTIFEYENDRPVRQATTGYNVEGAPFDVDVQKGSEPWKRMSLCILFANEQIEAGTELRWNYCYPEATVRKLFGAPVESSSSNPLKP